MYYLCVFEYLEKGLFPIFIGNSTSATVSIKTLICMYIKYNRLINKRENCTFSKTFHS